MSYDINMVNSPSHRAYNGQPSVDPFEVSTNTYLTQYPEIYGVVSAAIVIRNHRVLLVQRASNDDCPNLWEVPGGTANRDETIVQCAVRELQEEAGLAALGVISMIGEFEWSEKKPARNGYGWRDWKIFVFLITIDDAVGNVEIKLDPLEHQAYLWATEADIKEGLCDGIKLERISSNQKEAILAAFEISKPNRF